MKKLIVILAAINTLIAPAVATSMCVEDDTVVVVLDPTITGSVSGNTATFSYGRLYFVTTAVSQNYGNVVNEIIDNGVVMVGGESNGNVSYTRMVHPMVTPWVNGIVTGWIGNNVNGHRGVIFSAFAE